MGNLMEYFSNLTIEEKIGQMVMVGLEGVEMDPQTRSLIEMNHVGGFIFFRRNVIDSRQLLTLINSLKQVNKSPIPLFFAVDEEGGRVSRMPADLQQMPANQNVGQVNDETLCYRIGRTIGNVLLSFGFNMNLAPVLDINSCPDNPVIGDRSYGKDPEIVSRLGIHMMKGLQAENIIPVVKHFPGHGDTLLDSHIDLPILQHDVDRLKNFEWIPFSRAIQNQVDAIMTAHILLPKLDAEYPATLSKKIITDCLREKLHFQGVAMTDDLTMGAIANHYSLEEAALRAVQADCDIILVANGYENGQRVIHSLIQALQRGDIDEERIDRSVKRIFTLKNKYHLKNDPIPSIDIQTINRKINEILASMN